MRRVRISLREVMMFKLGPTLCGGFAGKWWVGDEAERETSREDRMSKGPVVGGTLA